MLSESSIKVERLLGEGLNANVYRAVSSSSEYGVEKVYALKVLKRKEDLNHFKKEFSTLSKVEGKHLVKLYGWHEYNKLPGLLIEYIDGLTLEELLSLNSLSQEESNWIYHEVIKGLLELNSYEIYHGDLSPKNIMVSKECEIKLIDFGLSRWRTTKLEVTPEFASPELLEGKTPTFQHDLYSLKKIFEQNKLTYKTQPEKTPPNSLFSKIENKKVFLVKTQQFKINQRPNPQIKLQAFSLLLAGLSLLKPLSAQNIIPNDVTMNIRSSKWMSVKPSGSSEWCFTPCSLKVTHLGTNTIDWKTQNNSGTTKVFIEEDNQTLFFSK